MKYLIAKSQRKFLIFIRWENNITKSGIELQIVHITDNGKHRITS